MISVLMPLRLLSRRAFNKIRNRCDVVHREQQVAFEAVPRRFQAKDHFEIRRVDGAEYTQARIGPVHANPFFAAITYFVEVI